MRKVKNITVRATPANCRQTRHLAAEYITAVPAMAGGPPASPEANPPRNGAPRVPTPGSVNLGFRHLPVTGHKDSNIPISSNLNILRLRKGGIV